MKRVLLLLLIFCGAGCADHDPCAGHDGTCLALRVSGSGSVDQLGVTLSGAAQLVGRTPLAAGPARPLPVTTALFLPPVSGPVEVAVVGYLGGTDVGSDDRSVSVRAGAHQQVDLNLAVSSPDLPMVPSDLAAPDLAAFDASSAPDFDFDLASADSFTPDLEGADLLTITPRRVFVLPAQSSVLGTLADLDQSCNDSAQAASLGSSFFALIAFPSPSPDPRLRYTRVPGREVVLPSGTQVATDATFFTTDHLHAIDQMADGTPATGCVFTMMTPNGDRIGSSSDCLGWSSAAVTEFGTYGDVTASDINWCLSSTATCDTLTCHVYCVEN